MEWGNQNRHTAYSREEGNMKPVNLVTLILIIVGGLNWGLVGAADFDLVATLFGAGSAPAKVVYVLVGISALVQLVILFVPKTESAK
jgi:uncharacterized membrane protein YuzA (DUF378 family)